MCQICHQVLPTLLSSVFETFYAEKWHSDFGSSSMCCTCHSDCQLQSKFSVHCPRNLGVTSHNATSLNRAFEYCG
uniref:Putative secreted protein n=1 Tax=Ixodes ricinus TaxID=34613 RepID=A0A6B0TVE1_IXORI